MQRDNDFVDQNNPYAAPVTQSTAWESQPTDDFSNEELRPFVTMWLSPRRTVRHIISVNPELHVLLLICLGGIGGALDRFSTQNAGDDLPMTAILGSAVIFGPLGALFGLWIGSHLIRITGVWMGGIGDRVHIKTAMAWASVPTFFGMLFWIPQIVLLGPDMFTTEMPRVAANPILALPLLVMGIAELILAIWAFILLCNAIAEVQGFRSAWRGFLNLLAAGLLVAIPVIGIAVLLMGLVAAT